MKKNSIEPTQIRSAEIENFSAPGDENLGAEIPDAVGQGLASALFAVRKVSLNEEPEHTGLAIAISQALTIIGADPHQWECALVNKAGPFENSHAKRGAGEHPATQGRSNAMQ